MTGIQFLDGDGNVLVEPETAPDPAPHTPQGNWRHRYGERARWNVARLRSRRGAAALALAAPVLWVAAAAVAVVATFQLVYSEGIRSDVLYVQAMDGWGRLANPQDGSPGGHGTRYGVLICVGAGILVVAAVLHVLRFRAAVPVALAGAAALGGCVATIWLEVHTEFDQIRSALDRSGVPAPSTLELRYGPLLWLELAAALVGAAGCITAALAAALAAKAPDGALAAEAPDGAPDGASPVPTEAHLTEAARNETVPDELLGEAIG